jgi:hypothetical protein
MPKLTPVQARTPKHAAVHRREFLCLAPAAALASSIPLGITSPRRSGNHLSIGEALAALWDHPEEGSASVVKPSTAERLDSLFSGCNVGLISASRSEFTTDVNQGRCASLWAYIWRRFGSIDVDVRFSEHGPFQTQTVTERCYLLLGGRGFDNGNLKGFLRQYGAIHDQRLVLYKPYDERSAYLLGTRHGVIPRRKQIVCVGEFRANKLPDYFSLIREQGSRINVETMRFPIRKSFFNRLGGEC